MAKKPTQTNVAMTLTRSIAFFLEHLEGIHDMTGNIQIYTHVSQREALINA